MAFTDLGSLGTINVKSLGTPIDFSPSRAVPAGRLVVLWVAYDSVYNIARPHGKMQERWACHDDEGNIWVTVGAETDTGGFFATGPAGILFISQLRRPLSTSSVITVDNQADSNLTAKALSAREFSLSPGMKWCVTDMGPQVGRQDATDPVPFSIGPLVSQEYLFLHLLAVEGPNTDTYTWDPDYTEIDGDGTTGGAVDSNIHVRGGFRIATLTGDTVDVSSDTADRDWCQVLVALCEVPPHVFPASPILDNFNRADEEPLDNSTWWTDRSCGPSSPGQPRLLELVGNQCVGGPTGAGGQQWEEFFENCVEVRVDIVTVGSTGFDVCIHLWNSSHDAQLLGNACSWRGPEFGNALYWGFTGGKVSFQGGVDPPLFRAHVEPIDGSKMGMKRTLAPYGGTGIERFYIDIGDGWEQVGAIYWMGGDVRIDGYLGLAVWDADSVVDNFGGREVACGVNSALPQIIRRRKKRGQLQRP